MVRDRSDTDLLFAFGSRVKTLREAHGLTREALGERAEISPQNIAKIENGDRFVTGESLGRLARALKSKPKDLFEFEGPDDRRRPTLRKLELLLQHKTEKRLALAHDVLSRIFQDLE